VRCRHNPEHVVRLDRLQQHEEEECGDLPQGCFLCGARVPQQNLAEHLEATHTWAEVALKQVAMQSDLEEMLQQQQAQQRAMAEIQETLTKVAMQSDLAELQEPLTKQQQQAMNDLRDTLIQFQEKLGNDPHSFRAAGLTAVRCRHEGYSAMECKEAGYSAAECKEAGYSIKDCKEVGLVITAMDCRQAGYSAMECKEAGHSIVECRQAGYLNDEINLVYQDVLAAAAKDFEGFFG